MRHETVVFVLHQWAQRDSTRGNYNFLPGEVIVVDQILSGTSKNPHSVKMPECDFALNCSFSYMRVVYVPVFSGSLYQKPQFRVSAKRVQSSWSCSTSCACYGLPVCLKKQNRQGQDGLAGKKPKAASMPPSAKRARGEGETDRSVLCHRFNGNCRPYRYLLSKKAPGMCMR